MDSMDVVSKTRVVPKNPNDVAVFGEKDIEGGCYHRIAHISTSTQTKMIFGLFLPSAFNHVVSSSIPVLFWLSGLTCDDTNFAIKAGPKAFAAAETRVRRHLEKNVAPFTFVPAFITVVSHFIIHMDII
jgi:hypothetical protein